MPDLLDPYGLAIGRTAGDAIALLDRGQGSAFSAMILLGLAAGLLLSFAAVWRVLVAKNLKKKDRKSKAEPEFAIAGLGLEAIFTTSAPGTDAPIWPQRGGANYGPQPGKGGEEAGIHEFKVLQTRMQAAFERRGTTTARGTGSVGMDGEDEPARQPEARASVAPPQDGAVAVPGPVAPSLADAAKSDAGKSDAGKSDGGKSDGGKSDGGKSDGGKSDGNLDKVAPARPEVATSVALGSEGTNPDALRVLALSISELKSGIDAVHLRLAPSDPSRTTLGFSPPSSDHFVAEVVERLGTAMALPVSSVVAAMAEVRSKLGAVSHTIAQLEAAEVPAARPLAEVERLAAEVAQLRQSFDTANNRIAADNWMAIQELKTYLDDRIEKAIVPRAIQKDMRAESDRDEQQQRIFADIRAAIDDSGGRIVERYAATIDTLAQSFADRLDVNLTGSLHELAATVTEMRQVVSGAAATNAQARSGVGEAAEEIRLATTTMQGALASMAAQARSDSDDSRHALVGEIRQTVAELGAATRQIEDSGAKAAARLTQVLDMAPAALSREAETAARSVHVAAEMIRGVADNLALRMEAHVVKSRQELDSTADAVRQTIAASQANASEEVRRATDDMRGAMSEVAERARADADATLGALAAELRQSVLEVGAAARHVEHTNSVAAGRLAEVIDMAPAVLGREADAAARTVQAATARLDEFANNFAQRLEANVSGSLNELAAASAELRQHVAATEAATTHARDHLAASAAEATREVLQATSGMRGAILAMSAQAQSESEIAGQALFDKIQRSLDDLGAAARFVDQSSASSAARLNEVIEALPAVLSQEAEAASRSVQAITDRIEAVAEGIVQRLGDNVANSLQELTSATAQLHQSMAVTQAVAAEAHSGVGEAAQEVRQATLDMRGAVASLASQVKAESESTHRALIEQIRASVAELAAASLKVEHSGSEMVSRLSEVIDVAPTTLSRDAEAAARSVQAATEKINALTSEFALRLDVDVTSPIHDLAAVMSEMRQAVAATEDAAVKARDYLAAGVGEATQQVRLATGDMRSALETVASRSLAETEAAQRAFTQQVRHSLDDLGLAALRFEESGSAVTARLNKAAEDAPAALVREAEAVAGILQKAAEVAQEKFDTAVAALAQETTRESALTAAALTRISEQLVRQASHTREALAGQLASTVSEIEEAAAGIAHTVASANANLTKSAESLQADVAGELIAAGKELAAAAQRSGVATVQSVAEIWQEALKARAVIEADLGKVRERLLVDAAQGHEAATRRLQEATGEVSETLAHFDGHFASSADGLAQMLRALLDEMRRLNTGVADRQGNLGQIPEFGGYPAPRNDPGGDLAGTAIALFGASEPARSIGVGSRTSRAVYDAPTLQAGVDRFVAGKRASGKAGRTS